MAKTVKIESRSRGRALFWLGIAILFGGIVAYGVQLFAFQRTTTPWYMLATGTLGFLLVLLAVIRRPTIVRVLALLFVGFLAGMQWHFLLSYVTLPVYAGPVKTGEPMPEFQTKRADGSDFTRADLAGDKATALVFFRGHW